MKRLAAFAGLLAAALAWASLPARANDYTYQRTLDSTAPAAGANRLAVRGYNGNVQFYGDTGTTVRIHAVLKARSADALRTLDVHTWRDGGTVRVEDVCPSMRSFFFWTFADCDIELVIHYPRALTLNVHSENGNIAVDGAGGAVSIANSNGNLAITNAASDVRAVNTNGNVHATLASNWRGSAIALRTNAGNVVLRVPRGFDATVTARVRLGEVEDTAHLRKGPVTVTATTTFGDVRISRE